MSDQEVFTGPVITALAFSGLSLLLAAAALGWQVVAFILSGGRVKVRLKLAEIIPYAGTSTISANDRGLRRTIPGDHPDLGQLPGLGMEVAHVVVENPGRVAVTITDVGLALDWGQKGGYRVSPRAFQIEDHGAYDSDGITYARLEPFSRVSLCFDFWSVVEAKRARAEGKPIRLHAYATVAGKVKKSNRHSAWVFQPDELTSREDPTRISVADVILRVMMREHWNHEDDPTPDNIHAEKVAMRLTPDSSPDDIKVAIVEVGRLFWAKPDSPAAYTAFAIRQQLDQYGDSLVWPDGGAADRTRDTPAP